MSIFKKATKKRRKLRLSIDGLSGSGKTYTALEIAARLAEDEQGRVALIDTEHGSAADYANLFDFDHATMKPPYNPDRLVKALMVAAEDGYPVVVIDGLSPFWDGSGGVLEIVDAAATNKFSGWKAGTPKQNAMVNAILAYPGHAIVTMRSKADFVVSSDGKPTKVGMAAVQRQGIEYEFALCLSMDLHHTATVTKSRVVEADERFARLHLGTMIENPDGELAEAMLAWLEDGTSAEDEAAAEVQRAEQRARAAAKETGEAVGGAATPTSSGTGSPIEAASAAAGTPEPPAAAPTASAAVGAIPAWLVKQHPEKVPERDERIAYRVLVLGEKPGVIAADEHVSTAIVRGAKKKWEEAHARGDWPRDTTTPAPAPAAAPATSTAPAAPESSPPSSSPAPSSEPPAPAQPELGEGEPPAEAPEAGSAPPAAASEDVDWFRPKDEPTAESGWSDDLRERYARVLGELAEAGAEPSVGWAAAIERRCGEWFGHGSEQLARQEVLTLLERLEGTLHAARQPAPA